MINTVERQKRLTALACFAELSSDESRALATAMSEQQFAPGEIIVAEDALVDSVYILTQGKAEVSHLEQAKKSRLKFHKKKSASHKIPLAVLQAGEAIGLNDTGFFSTTGKRTATVTALTEVSALKLDLKDLHKFLRKHPAVKTTMLASAEQMLRMNLIKQSLPFSRLSPERLMILAAQVEIVQVKSGEIIFREGESGDRCYLVRSGKVEILTKNEEGKEHQLAVLSAPALFGEATLITHAPRNATARALESCELLELKYAFLSELIESENNVAATFMNLMVDRSRPLQNPHIVAYERTTADGQFIVILKNPDNGNYFKLSREGWFIWQEMNGERTMQEITLALADQYNVFAPDVVAALISKLAKTGFVTHVELENEMMNIKRPWLTKALFATRRILESRVAFGDADKWITKLYQRGAYLFFKPVTKIFLVILMMCGLISFGLATQHVISIFKTMESSWTLILFLIPATLISVVLHELGHALATKSCGNEVHYMGVGWYWLSPIAFTDTSDMWLSTRAPRIFVNMAGVYTDMLVGGVSALLVFLLPWDYAQAFFWLFALFTYLSAFHMMNPLQELDGYYVLMDVFDRPRLRQSAVAWLIKDFPRALRQPALFRQHIPEVCYWLACLLFILMVSLLTLFVQSFIFKILGFQPNSLIVNFLLPVLAALLSCVGIFADIREQAEEEKN